MVSPATFLYRLQVIDLALTKRRSRLTEIQNILGKDERVSQARTALENATKTLRPWQTKAQNLDLEIQSLTQKIKNTDQTLYSGTIKNPKTLQELQEEIASLKRRQGQLEDDMLEAMVNVEDGQKSVATMQKALNEAQALFAGTQHDLLDEQQRLEKEVAEFTLQRNQAAGALDAALLKTYEGLRTKKHGMPVALLTDDSCQTCGVRQTSINASKARQGDALVLCESCGRILASQP